MAGEQDVDIAAMLNALEWDFDDDTFRLRMAEMIGSLCLMVHSLRGIVYSMVFSGAVKFDPTWAENFDVLYRSIDRHEAFVWEVAPPRSILMQLRVLRRQGYLDEEWKKLLLGDSHGRLEKLDDGGEDVAARTILRRLIRRDDNTELPQDIDTLGGQQ